MAQHMIPHAEKCQQGRRPAWLNREFRLELGEKEAIRPLEEGTGNSEGIQGYQGYPGLKLNWNLIWLLL